MVLDYRAACPPADRYLCYDEDTGEAVGDVFYYDTEAHRVGRYRRDALGRLYADPRTSELAVRWEHRRLRLVRLLGED